MSRSSPTVTGGRPPTMGVIPGRWALSVGNPGVVAPSGFRWVSLAGVARLESGHTPSRRVPEYWDGDICWIGIRDATANHGRMISTTNERITTRGVDNSSTRLLPIQTVCLSRTASVGYVVMMGQEMTTSQDFVNWICGPHLNPWYLLYVLVCEQESIRRFAHGTTHQTLYYPEAKALWVCIPSRIEQDKIASVLRTIDCKIENCRSIKRKCWDLSLALYDRAILNKGTVSNVGAAAVFYNHLRVPLAGRQRTERQGPFPYYGAAGPVDSIDGFLFEGVHILVGEDGTVTSDGTHPMVQYVWDKFWVNNHAHVLKGNGVSDELLLCALLRSDVTPALTGAVQPKLNMGNLRAIQLRLPNHPGALETELSTLFEGYRSAAREELAATRIKDALVPKLLSGEVRLRGEHRVETAL